MSKEIERIARILDEDERPILNAEFIKIPEILFDRYRPDQIIEALRNRDGHMALQMLQCVMYAARKAGLVEYPDEDEFELAYDESGMYDDDGYSPQIPPGGSAMVQVIQKGWGFKTGKGIRPVVKAKVRII